jgi:hypothetical protein
MRWKLAGLLFGAALAATGDPAVAYHSAAMFDQEHPLELTSVVREYRFSVPHASILLGVNEDGAAAAWSLDGASAFPPPAF